MLISHNEVPVIILKVRGGYIDLGGGRMVRALPYCQGYTWKIIMADQHMS